MTNLEDVFIERTKRHIELVNKFAAKVGKEYPNHDSSKLDMLLDGYKYFSKPKEQRTEEEQQALDMATLIHITNSPHHPEYWTNTNLKGFTRSNFSPNGLIDATEMPLENLIETCADWCAVSYEKGTNDPFQWLHKVNGTRWLFSPEQVKFIRETLEKMWNE